MLKKTYAALAFLFITGVTQAAELDITTEFKPSAADPEYNQFKNTTEHSGYCAVYPTDCNGEFTLLTGITATNRVLNIDSSDLRDHHYQYANAVWKTVILKDPISRQEMAVSFRIHFISYRLEGKSSTSWENTDHNVAGLRPEGDCTRGINARVSTRIYEFGWFHPEGMNACFKKIKNIKLNDIDVTRISIGYEMVSPASPMNLHNGNYRGTVEYRVGNGSEIDVGNANYSDNVLKINIQATVEHDFKVEHSGPDKVELKPAGGWESLNGSGESAARLEGESSFALTASSPFSMYTHCQHSTLGSCALKMDDADVLVPFSIVVSMPGMKEKNTGLPVTNMNVPLWREGMPVYTIVPIYYNNAVVSPVKFFVSEPDSQRMLSRPGSTWRGSATLVFDADLPFASGGS